METTQISIDLEVYKAIEHDRKSFIDTINDILRRKYELDPLDRGSSQPESGGLHTRGTLLRNGLKLHRSFKGTLHEAKVENSKIIYNGKAFTSPSPAAGEATGNSVNGWKWWQYLDEDLGRWRLLDRLRKKQRVS